MIIRSDWRGEPRKTSAPKRAISKREADIDIISMAQQASPNDIGQMEFFRAQLIALPREVVRMSWESRLSSKPALSMRAKRSSMSSCSHESGPHANDPPALRSISEAMESFARQKKALA